MNARAEITAFEEVDPRPARALRRQAKHSLEWLTEVFVARCEARATLVASCDMDLHDAVDGLQEAADIDYGLTARLGADHVQALMAHAFEQWGP